jgi:hypothetical protein
LGNSWTERSLDRHAPERYATLDQLKAENPGIEQRHAPAFDQALARADYFAARWDMADGRVDEARRTLAKIAGKRQTYRVLYLMSFCPPVWRIAHNRHIKHKLTNLFLRNN